MLRDSERLVFNVFNQLTSPQIMGLLVPKHINSSYQFISSLVSTVLGHLNRVLLEKGEQVCMQTYSDLGLRVAKVMRLLEILGYTRA